MDFAQVNNFHIFGDPSFDFTNAILDAAIVQSSTCTARTIKQIWPTSGTACYRLISITQILHKVVLIPGPGTHALCRTKISIGYILRTKNK
jgi:hypothetical protein